MLFRSYWSRRRATPAVEAELAATWAELPDLLAAADFVSLHVSLEASTRHLIDAVALRRMRPTAVLVNTSRGPVVDQAALADALRAGVIAGAALDVTDPEPIRTDDPLLGLDNCLVVPHIGSASGATRDRMARMAAANLIAGVRGEPLPTPAAKRAPAQPALDWNALLVLGVVLVFVVGGVLRAMFGRLAGSGILSVIAAFLAWMVGGAFIVAIVVGIVAFVFSL